MSGYRDTKFTPILFGTGFSTLSEGGTVIPDMGLMSSVFRRPMLVDEIRWSYITPTAFDLNSMASSLRCKLTLGRMAITAVRDGGGFVPIWSFGPPLQAPSMVEEVRDVGFAASLNCGHFRWKLPKPLYVPAGQSLTPQFSRQADGLGGTARIGISIAGRQFGEADKCLPERIDVPFVAYYEPAASTVASAMSAELDLANPFQVPLHVQRLLCRQYQQSAAATSRGEGQIVTAAGSIANVTIQDSQGYNIVRDVTPLSNVFDGLRRGWTFQRALAPKERYLVQVSAINNASGSPTTFTMPQFSMVGWRTEVFK